MNDKEFEQAIARVTCSVWGPSMGRRMNQRDIKQRQQIASLKAELDAVLAMVSMLEEKEWAEHAGRGPISNRLEACITELHGEISEAHETAPPAAAHGDEAVRKIVLPTPEQVMNVVMKFQWEHRKNGTGTTNWAANLGMTVVEYVARMNPAPPAAAHGDSLSFSTAQELATAIRQVAAYEDLGPELIAEEMFKQAGAAEAAMRAQGDGHD